MEEVVTHEPHRTVKTSAGGGGAMSAVTIGKPEVTGQRSEILTPARKTIRVTRADIWHGEKGQPDRCPVARAVNRQLGLNGLIGTTKYDLLGTRLPAHSKLLPAEVTDFIVRFDGSEVPRFLRPLFFRPFEFSIEL
jgi:hypothetical protein